jgi:hypothetical protein
MKWQWGLGTALLAEQGAFFAAAGAAGAAACRQKEKMCVSFPLCRPWFMAVFFSEETKSTWTTAMKCGGMMVSFVDWTHMFGPAYGFGACK